MSDSQEPLWWEQYGPPPDRRGPSLVTWALEQIRDATTEGEIRAAVRVLLAPERAARPTGAYMAYVHRRLLEVGAKPPEA
jgi:hypothetical protein